MRACVAYVSLLRPASLKQRPAQAAASVRVSRPPCCSCRCSRAATSVCNGPRSHAPRRPPAPLLLPSHAGAFELLLVHARDAIPPGADAAAVPAAETAFAASSASVLAVQRVSSLVFSRLQVGRYPTDEELVSALARVLEGESSAPTHLPRSH
jgi:hypothetical protein